MSSGSIGLERMRTMGSRVWGCSGGETRHNASHAESAANEIKKAQSRKAFFNCWDWCMGGSRDRERGRIRFGFMLIMLGLLWLAGVGGWLPPDSMFPLTVITIGLWLAVLSRIRWKRKTRSFPGIPRAK
jgi:hypothetical protein